MLNSPEIFQAIDADSPFSRIQPFPRFVPMVLFVDYGHDQITLKAMKKLFQGETEYCTVIKIWLDGVEIKPIHQLGSVGRLELRDKQYHMWCDRDVRPEMGKFFLWENDTEKTPIQISSSELIRVTSEEGSTNRVCQVFFTKGATVKLPIPPVRSDSSGAAPIDESSKKAENN